jgi:hypothetical protein
MSKAAREFFEREDSGGVTPPGLRDGKFFSDIWSELKHQRDAGAHEVAAALWTGSAFVMYQRHEGQEIVEQPLHGLPEDTKAQEVDHGREM